LCPPHARCRWWASARTSWGIPRDTLHGWLVEKRKGSEFNQPSESRQHFDIWQFHKSDGDSSYFGRMPPQVVENLLWLYTDVGDIVVDPFAGGGTTIKVANEMGRRVFSSDIKPSTPMLPIHEHDITMGWHAAVPGNALLSSFLSVLKNRTDNGLRSEA
jgi:hypothetical protein